MEMNANSAIILSVIVQCLHNFGNLLNFPLSQREVFSLARLSIIRQSCVVLRKIFVQLGKSFRGGATTPFVASEYSCIHVQ